MAAETDSLPPTQQLVLEVLAARERLGEPAWTFTVRVKPALEALSRAGLTWWKHATIPHHCLAGLTQAGRDAVMLAGYIPPATVTTVWGVRWDEGHEQSYGDGDLGEHVARSVTADHEKSHTPGTLIRRTVTYGPWREVAAEERAEQLMREWRARG